MGSILFVCTANICRSPMAAALFQACIAGLENGGGWRIESAGVWTKNGQPASPGAIAAMKSRGLDIRCHRSREVSAALLEPFRLILTMERSQKEALQAEFPQIADRVFLLRELVGESADVEDPFGSNQAAYEATADELNDLFVKARDKILQLSQP